MSADTAVSLATLVEAGIAALPHDALHAVLVRPPDLGWDGTRYRGHRLASLHVPPMPFMPGVVAVVHEASFIGVVAVSPIHARQAADGIHPVWQPVHREEDSASDVATETGPAYSWRLKGCRSDAGHRAVAWCVDDHVTVWVPGSPAHHGMCREEVARLLRVPLANVVLLQIGAAATLHPLDLMDAAADAALLSRAVARPVSVPVTTADRPGVLMLHAVAGSVDDRPDAGQADTGFATMLSSSGPGPDAASLAAPTPWAVRPSLARLLGAPHLGHPSSRASVLADEPRHAPAGEVALVNAGAADLDAAWVFAQQSLLDEQARQVGKDPLAHRLAALPPGPARRLARQLAQQAGWRIGQDADSAAVPVDVRSHVDGRLRGRGFASAHVSHGVEGSRRGETWSAWIAEVAVDPRTGHIEVARVFVGHESTALNAARSATFESRSPVWLETAQRLLDAPAKFDDWGSPAAPTHGADTGTLMAMDASMQLEPYREPPHARGAIEEGALAVDGVLTLPAAAAIANAIHDATGIRLREAPFDGEQLRLALQSPERRAPWRAWIRRSRIGLVAVAGGIAGLVATAWPLKPAIAPTSEPALPVYSAAAIERGRLVAAAGDCVVCHTAAKGVRNAGGFPLETPFGTIYSTNITPDPETGIGRWSYAAFERAMRHGIHRDGRQLYPAFPYTAFAKISEADMQSLYGYLMAQPPVKSEVPETRLAFPYSLRPSLAGWNLLFHDSSAFRPDASRSAEWNRGAYLVQGAGHCGACHTPRNALGAEKTGIHFLAGGEAEGWTAPPLNRLRSGQAPWTVDGLYRYLRTGFSAEHGVAAGPMAPIVHGLAELPESDVWAISSYLLSLDTQRELAAAPLVGEPHAGTRLFQGERIYRNACAACHEAGTGPTLFGVKPLLGSITSLRADRPDNLMQVILHGIQSPADSDLGYMPGFGDSLDDAQVADLARYLRARFVPDAKAWKDEEQAARRARQHAPGG